MSTTSIPRSLQIALLDDENGVSEKVWDEIRDLVDGDIYDAVDATDGRFYLPEGWAASNG